MSNQKGTIHRHRFHGDPDRFPLVAAYIAEQFKDSIRYIADVAGGQGMLTRILRKKYNYDAEVIDPRGFRLKGVPGKEELFNHKTADYYDLIIGLHPDEALKEITEAAKIRPTLLIPCCNFWDTEKTLNNEQLLSELEEYYKKERISFQKVKLSFKGGKNNGFITQVTNSNLSTQNRKIRC